jgi:CBS-domain-containing membrane protein
MWRHSCAYLLIVDTDGCPTGIVTDRALFNAAQVQSKPLAQIRVSSIEHNYTLTPHRAPPLRRSEASKAPRLLHAIPVLDGDGSLVNIVTEQWLIAYTQSWVRTRRLMGVDAKDQLPLLD